VQAPHAPVLPALKLGSLFLKPKAKLKATLQLALVRRLILLPKLAAVDGVIGPLTGTDSGNGCVAILLIWQGSLPAMLQCITSPT
jgi:hypothetical protein